MRGSRLAVCHGDTAMGNNELPDLRWSPMLEAKAWSSIVLDGAERETGMNSFQRFLQPADVEAIRAYVVSEARKELAAPVPN